MRRAAATFGGVLVTLVLTGSAAAAPGWLPASTLGQGAKGNECAGRTTLDAGGDAAAAWTTAEGVQLATRQAGGSWQLATPIAFGSPVCVQDVQSNARGDAVAVWERYDGSRVWVEASVRPAGGGWAVPFAVGVGKAGSSEVMPAKVALDLKGDAFVVFRSNQTQEVWGRFYEAGSRTWAPFPYGVSTSFDVTGYGLGVGLDARGNAVAVWQKEAAGKETVEATYIAFAGFNPTPQVEALSAEAAQVAGSRPVVAMNDGGEAVAVFAHAGGAGTAIQTATRHPGSPWLLAEELSLPGQAGERPAVTIDGAGNATAVWAHPSGKEAVIQASSRAAGGAWTPPLAISESGQTAAAPAIAGDGSGEAVAAWTLGAAAGVVQATRRTAAGAWQPPVTLSGTGAYQSSVALDARGDALALWEVEGASREVQAAGYAAGGPVVGALLIPASGIAGQPVVMSASAIDEWTTFSQTWSFGDGSGGAGGSVSHVYDTPGTYDVTYTATDTLLNAGTGSGVIVIAPATSPRVAPVLSSLRQAHRTWRERGPRSRRRPPVGTTFAFSVSERASVTLAFSQLLPGRMVGRRCVRVTRADRHRKACVLGLPRLALTVVAHAGANSLAFDGRVGRTRLPAGAYAVTATATAAGLRSRPQRLTFTIAG